MAADVTPLVQAHAELRARLAAAAAAAAAEETRAFTKWYETAAITLLAGRIVKKVEAAQRQTATATDAYLLRVLAAMTGQRPDPSGRLPLRGLRTGVDSHAAVYGRLADQFRYEVSTGVDQATALDHVTTRAEVMATTDVDLAFRAQARLTLVHSDRVRGYRRVLHPELSAGGTCGLCIAASDRIYKRGDLMPLHGRCRCTVLPVVGELDPGQSLNQADLKALYESAGSTAARDLKKVRAATVQHGELGPQLRVQSQAFRGPDDVQAA